MPEQRLGMETFRLLLRQVHILLSVATLQVRARGHGRRNVRRDRILLEGFKGGAGHSSGHRRHNLLLEAVLLLEQCVRQQRLDGRSRGLDLLPENRHQGVPLVDVLRIIPPS
jgi:hypothetical protein